MEIFKTEYHVMLRIDNYNGIGGVALMTQFFHATDEEDLALQVEDSLAHVKDNGLRLGVPVDDMLMTWEILK